MTSLTYLQFHAFFLLPPVVLLLAVGRTSRRRLPGRLRTLTGWRAYWVGVGIVTAVALAYTTPWDNLLIARGVWWYGEGATVATVGNAPIEEYLFIVVQPILTGLWLSNLPFRATWPTAARPRRSRLFGLALAVAVGVVGWRLLASEATVYLGAILSWAAPVLALQWTVGAPQLWARRHVVAVGTLVPTAYLCAVDRVAIEAGVWTISARYTTGQSLLGLPVEEAVFFLVTNLFVVQGLVLYRLVVSRWGAVPGFGVSTEPRIPRRGDRDNADTNRGTDADADTNGGTRGDTDDIDIDTDIETARGSVDGDR
ncbi:lycopene cyclase domain-containing protein [Halobellus sp. GM3]|uniref:lycopene cyclase domain-containing protein n=1 Tax=Halobellus sp. GM3 TaxID=3458410 RepID=UPI00403D9AE9